MTTLRSIRSGQGCSSARRPKGGTCVSSAIERLAAYQNPVRQLEFDNERLREALIESEAEARSLSLELHPPPAHLVHLHGIDTSPPVEGAPPPSQLRRTGGATPNPSGSRIGAK